MAKEKRYFISGASEIATRSHVFTKDVGGRLGILATGRDAMGAHERYQLRENLISYKAYFKAKNEDIDLENTYH